MQVLIAYASVEGQTRKIADFVAATLRGAGHDVTVHNVDDASEPPDPERFDRVILAASIHRGRHPLAFEKFVAPLSARIAARPNLLLSVSLCAAFPEGQETARGYVEEFAQRTRFTPGKVALVPGAVQYEKYLDYEAMVVRLVALHLQQFYFDKEDREFTDWPALEAEVIAFIADDAGTSPGPRETAPPGGSDGA